MDTDGNLLLRALPGPELARLRPCLTRVRLEQKKILEREGDPVAMLYFPCSGVVSLTKDMRDGSTVEVATVGPEGVVGIGGLFPQGVALSQSIVQVPGAAARIDVRRLRELLPKTPRLQVLLERFVAATIQHTVQAVACNRRHGIERRFARWLLLAHDRARSDSFELTQTFIAEMLGVRRASVSTVAMRFQRARLIRYDRGVVRVLDRPGLETSSCECYATMRQATNQVFDTGEEPGADAATRERLRRARWS